MAADVASVLTAIVFVATWLMTASAKYKGFPLGRAASAITGAVLAILVGGIAFNDALATIGKRLEVRTYSASTVGARMCN